MSQKHTRRYGRLTGGRQTFLRTANGPYNNPSCTEVYPYANPNLMKLIQTQLTLIQTLMTLIVEKTNPSDQKGLPVKNIEEAWVVIFVLEKV